MHCSLVTDLESGAADIQDRGLHYGDGLFETMLMSHGQIRYWPEHFERLSGSAERLGIPCPQGSWFDDALSGYRDIPGDQIIKLILTRGSGGRGLTWPDDPKPTVYLLHYPFKPDSRGIPIAASIIPSALSGNQRLAGIKHLNRLDYVLATRTLSRRDGFNEALLGDQQGYLVEGIVNNLFFIVDGEVHTPLLDDCGVAGVMRGLIIKRLKAAGKQVTIGRYRADDIMQADELFYCNSVQGIRPVVRLDDTRFQAGPLSTELQRMFNVSQTA